LSDDAEEDEGDGTDGNQEPQTYEQHRNLLKKDSILNGLDTDNSSIGEDESNSSFHDLTSKGAAGGGSGYAMNTSGTKPTGQYTGASNGLKYYVKKNIKDSGLSKNSASQKFGRESDSTDNNRITPNSMISYNRASSQLSES
jgi:hypothetical protein